MFCAVIFYFLPHRTLFVTPYSFYLTIIFLSHRIIFISAYFPLAPAFFTHIALPPLFSSVAPLIPLLPLVIYSHFFTHFALLPLCFLHAFLLYMNRCSYIHVSHGDSFLLISIHSFLFQYILFCFNTFILVSIHSFLFQHILFISIHSFLAQYILS